MKRTVVHHIHALSRSSPPGKASQYHTHLRWQSIRCDNPSGHFELLCHILVRKSHQSRQCHLQYYDSIGRLYDCDRQAVCLERSSLAVTQCLPPACSPQFKTFIVARRLVRGELALSPSLTRAFDLQRVSITAAPTQAIRTSVHTVTPLDIASKLPKRCKPRTTGTYPAQRTY